MMPNLRARIRAATEKPREEAKPCHCQVIESRMPLSDLPGLHAVTAESVRRFGVPLETYDLSRTLFLDTETTGLRGAGTVAFLVGVGYVDGNDFVVQQLLMRDYPEEAHLLSLVADHMDKHDTIVSFNGKSFDVPLLCDRFTMARLRDRWRPLAQLDLLHPARRTFKMRLGSCTLSRLETETLGIAREHDLPGAEVPERFFQFLKTGDRSLLDDVLTHNLQDIRTLAVLLAKLSAMYGAPDVQTELEDVYSMGRALDRVGERDMARRCYRVASVSKLSGRARLDIALSYRKEKDYARAADAYRELIAHGEADAMAYAALAILLERYLGDVEGALSVTEAGLLRLSGAGFLHKGADEMSLMALERRRARLVARIARNRR